MRVGISPGAVRTERLLEGFRVLADVGCAAYFFDVCDSISRPVARCLLPRARASKSLLASLPPLRSFVIATRAAHPSLA